MKKKVQIILVISGTIFFNSVTITCAYKDMANTKIEKVGTVTLSPEIETPLRMLQSFLFR